MKSTKLRLKALGMVNALGNNTSAVRKALFEGELKLTQNQDFVPAFSTWVGAVEADLPSVPKEFKQFNSRNSRLMLLAFQEIQPLVLELREQLGRERIGVVLGTSTSGIAESEIAMRDFNANGAFDPDYHLRKQEIGSVSKFLSYYADLGGPSYAVSTACSSSVKVFASARNLLNANICDAVVVGGVDSLCRMTLNGFHSLELLSQDVCKPLSQGRSGINIGEGAALFLMTKEESGVQLLGIGESCDAYHISAPEPNGIGALSAMRAALKDAEINSEEVDYINLHGTGTQQNDAMESKAIRELFSKDIPCSSTKGLVGHTLGAAGATEVGFCWLTLTQANTSYLPPHGGFHSHVQDPELPKLDLVRPGTPYKESFENAIMLSNSFAFGGNNCSIIIGRKSGDEH